MAEKGEIRNAPHQRVLKGIRGTLAVDFLGTRRGVGIANKPIALGGGKRDRL